MGGTKKTKDSDRESTSVLNSINNMVDMLNLNDLMMLQTNVSKDPYSLVRYAINFT